MTDETAADAQAQQIEPSTEQPGDALPRRLWPVLVRSGLTPFTVETRCTPTVISTKHRFSPLMRRLRQNTH